MKKETENKNLELWDRVEKTNPKYTKQVNFGRKYTAIDAQYQIKNATAEFGSYGEWGLRNISYETFDVPAIQNNPQNVMLKISAEFFYPKDGKIVAFEISNSSLMFSSKGKIDEDIYKKIETNTLTKALSKIGFNADIFLGKFEDANYINEVATEFISISNEQRNTLAKMIQDSETDVSKFNEVFGIDNLAGLSVSDFNKAFAMLQTKINAKKRKQNEDSDKN